MKSSTRPQRDQGRPTTIVHHLFDPESGEVRWKHYRRYGPDGSKKVWWKSVDPATGKWANGLFGRAPASLPLWNAHRLKSFPPEEPVVLVEGEMAGQALAALGIPVVATVTGAPDVPERNVLAILTGHPVAIWRDNDHPGALLMQGVARALAGGIAASLRWISCPDAPHKADAADYVRMNGADATRDIIARAQAEMPPVPAPSADGDPTYARRASGSAHGKRPPTQGELLAGAVRETEEGGAELFHDLDGRAHVTLPIGEHRKTLAVRSHGFRAWLSHEFYKGQKKAPSTQAVEDFLRVLEGRALFDGPEHPVFVRVGSTPTAIYLDLGDPGWRCIEITSTRWLVIPHPAHMKFRRAPGMAPLPLPVPGGNVDLLRSFMNPSSGDTDWTLFMSWLVGTLSRGPYVILVLHGEQGSLKSTTTRVLRRVIDPSTVPLRSEPREPRDLMIAAKHGWILCYDNLSHLPQWLSDAVCRLSTGGGFGTRALFTDEDEVLFEAMRPTILNGIEELVTRGDFLDRSIILRLPPIPDAQRRSETELWSDFEARHPEILGGLLDAAVGALARHDGVRLATHPRMADFARWVVAAEPGLGWPEGTFLRAYADNRGRANEVALEASPIVPPLLRLLDENGGEWIGPTTALLAALAQRAEEITKAGKGWPKTAQALTGALDRVLPNLRMVGIEVTRHKSGGKRWLEARKLAGDLVPHVPHVPDPRETSAADRDEPGDEGGRVDLKHVPDLVPSANPRNSTQRDERDERDEVSPALSTCPPAPSAIPLDPLVAEAIQRFDNAVIEVRPAPGTTPAEEEKTSP